MAKLRYRLTIPNLHALGAGLKDVGEWRRLFETKLENAEEELRDLFMRSNKAKNEREEEFRSFIRKCRNEIDSIFSKVESLDDAKLRVMEMIEATPYRMLLTPGYYVMKLNHPEIIEAWLRDPRAKQFEEYPEALLVWESAALPKRIYYSQIADGTLSVGICGVNAEILDNCPAYYELQEILDESGPRFRHIICEDEFQQLEEELKEDLMMKKGRPRLWASALRKFRRHGYYHFHSPWDYHTKLIYDNDPSLRHFQQRNWVSHRGGSWQELTSLNKTDVPALIGAEHIPLLEKDKWRTERQDGNKDLYETDFMKMYLDNYIKRGWAESRPNLEGARLHKVKMKGTADPEKGDTSLLVLIPDSQDSDFAKDLINRFLTQCELAFEDYEKAIIWSKTYTPSNTDAARTEHYDVFLCYNHKERDAVMAIAEQLKERDIKPWIDIKFIRPGTGWLYELQEQIEKIGSAIVFCGKDGLGAFQNTFEVEAFLRRT